MFEKLATFAYSNRRRVLFVAVVGAADRRRVRRRGVEAPEPVRRR